MGVHDRRQGRLQQSCNLKNEGYIQKRFTDPLLQWFKQHGRHHLPWQHPKTPYRIYVSEMMLQQTQVHTVIPFFERFMARFPTLASLAQAHIDDVLALWAGLGYYQRARKLYETAQIIQKTYQGIFPYTPSTLIKLPGIGPSTAAAICSLAFNAPTPILDGNVQRILTRYFKINGSLQHRSTVQKLWAYAQQCMSKTACSDYTQAIMDLGALCCKAKNPDCYHCPLQTSCLAFQHQAVTQYPKKKPRIVLPHKHEQFLLLTTPEQELFLEKRPDVGIWGGLWSIPTLPYEQALSTYLLNQTWSVRQVIPLATFKHTFTHFHLHLHPFIIILNQKPIYLPQENWFTKTQATHLGKPKPIQKLLDLFWS